MREPDEGYKTARRELLAGLRAHFATQALGPSAIENRIEVAEEVLSAMTEGGYLLVGGYVYRIARCDPDGAGESFSRWTIYTHNFEEDE